MKQSQFERAMVLVSQIRKLEEKIRVLSGTYDPVDNAFYFITSAGKESWNVGDLGIGKRYHKSMEKFFTMILFEYGIELEKLKKEFEEL